MAKSGYRAARINLAYFVDVHDRPGGRPDASLHGGSYTRARPPTIAPTARPGAIARRVRASSRGIAAAAKKRTLGRVRGHGDGRVVRKGGVRPSSQTT